MKREIKTTLALDGEKAFKQGLADAARQMRVLDSEMKSTKASFAGNEKSLESLTARGKIFERQVAQQKEVVAALAKAVKESAQKYGEADRRTDGYRINLNNATAALAKMERELEQNSKAISEFGRDTDVAASKMDKLRAKAQQMADGMKNAGDKLSGMGQKMSMGVTAPLVAGFALATQGTKALRGDLATLSTNAKIAGQDMGVANDALIKMQAVTGETDSNIEGLSNIMATGFRDEKLTELVDALAGASIKFKDTMKFEGMADGLQETLATGAAIGPFAELLERSGIALDGFNEGLTAAIANGTQENYVLQELAKTGLAQTYEAYRANNEEMVKAEEANFRMQIAMAKLGAALEPILTPIIEKVTELINKFNEMDPAAQNITLAVLGIAAALGPVLTVVGNVMKVAGGIIGFFKVGEGGVSSFSRVLQTLTRVGGVLVRVLGILARAISWPVAIISAVVVAGVALYKNWDTVSAKAQELWQKITEIWSNIKSAVSTSLQGVLSDIGAYSPVGLVVSQWDEIKAYIGAAWENIKTTVGNALDAIYSFFANLRLPEIKIPHIKLPHFSISGEFNLSPPSVPKLGVEWYKTGGIFTSPTIIGVGEAGTEAVIPLDRLERMLARYLHLPRGAQVFSNRESRAIAGRHVVDHSGTVYHVFATNDKQIVAKIAQEFERGNRRIPSRVATMPSMA